MPPNRRSFIRRNLLTVLTCIGVVSGVVVAIILKSIATEKYTKRQIMYIQFPGDLFLRYVIQKAYSFTIEHHHHNKFHLFIITGANLDEEKICNNNVCFLLFIFRMLKCLIVPLLVSSIACAIGSLDLSMSKKIAGR